MNTDQLIKRPQYGGWKPTSPRKKEEDKMIPLYVMVRRKNYTKAKIHLTNEAKKYR